MALSPTSVSVAAALAVIGFAPAAHATFIIDTNPNTSTEIGLTLTRVGAANPSTTGSGMVGTYGTVAIAVDTPSSFSAGVSHIFPQGGGNLTNLTFTPDTGSTFREFTFRGQDNVGNQQITITVQDNQGDAPQTFTVTGPPHHALFAPIAIKGTNGETIKSVTISNSGGFSNARQFTFSLASGVPEAASWALMLVGVGLAGAQLRRKRARRARMA
jgi:hypothetical protein